MSIEKSKNANFIEIADYQNQTNFHFYKAQTKFRAVFRDASFSVFIDDLIFRTGFAG